jgi:hypothetical protein
MECSGVEDDAGFVLDMMKESNSEVFTGSEDCVAGCQQAAHCRRKRRAGAVVVVVVVVVVV